MAKLATRIALLVGAAFSIGAAAPAMAQYQNYPSQQQNDQRWGNDNDGYDADGDGRDYDRDGRDYDRDDRGYYQNGDERQDGYDRGYDNSDRGGYDRDDRRGFASPYRLRGPGVASLDPWLRGTPAGMRFARRYARNGNGYIQADAAYRANRDFRRLADRNRDGRLSQDEVRFGLAQIRGGYGDDRRYDDGRRY